MGAMVKGSRGGGVEGGQQGKDGRRVRGGAESRVYKLRYVYNDCVSVSSTDSSLRRRQQVSI